MVHAAGTDNDIPIRVSHLESSVSQLHMDNQRTQAALAGISAQQEAQGKLLSDIANKLDQTRTARPNIGMFVTIGISAVSLIMLIGVLSFSPVYREMDNSNVIHKDMADVLMHRTGIISEALARMEHVEKHANSLESRMLGVESNRFSKQDGQRLEDSLREAIEK